MRAYVGLSEHFLPTTGLGVWSEAGKRLATHQQDCLPTEIWRQMYFTSSELGGK